MKSKILVTGGAGYIGSHACKALAAAGFEPITYDNLSRGNPWAVKWGPLEEGDLNDSVRLRDVFDRHQPSAVMHFAARAYVGESVDDPKSYYRNNVGGSLALLETMAETGVRRIVFSSSCAVYGTPETPHIDEQMPLAPVNPYGATKMLVERMLADFATAYGLEAISLRYFNAAGADPDGEIGECHDPETHLIPLAIETAIGMRDTFVIHGTDYPTPDGTCVRDFIHVSDLARAHTRALQAFDGTPGAKAYNLGTGVGHSVREIITRIEAASGRRLPVRAGPRRAGDPAFLVAEAGRAQTDLGWRPEFSDIDSIVRTALSWHERRA